MGKFYENTFFYGQTRQTHKRKTPCRLSDFYNLNLGKWGDI